MAREASSLKALKEQAPVTQIRARATASYQLLTAFVIVICAVLVAFFIHATVDDAVPAASQVGRVYGLIGVALMAFLAAYGIRRYAYRARIMRLETWYRAHLVLGVVTLTLLGCHSGFAFRSMFLGTLQVSFWGAVLTGIFGWGYQTVLRNWMVHHEFRPTVLRELDESLTAARESLEKQVAGLETEAAGLGGISLQKLVAHVVQQMGHIRFQHVWRFPDHSYWERRVHAVLKKVGVADLPPEVQVVIVELNHLEVLRWYHVVLRAWTTLHLWFTFFAIQMMVWHCWMVGRYPR